MQNPDSERPGHVGAGQLAVVNAEASKQQVEGAALNKDGGVLD